MGNLIQYLQDNAVQCEPKDGEANMIFFGVNTGQNPNTDELLAAIKEHKGVFNDVDLFDGKEHSYIEIGGWIGDQGAALMLMGLGSILGIWKLLTPFSVLGNIITDEVAMQMAGRGMVAILYRPTDKGEPS